MWRVYDCLTVDHDYRLLVVAVAICFFGVAATFAVAARVRQSNRRSGWMAVIALCGGATVWSTHFIAMLAFRRELPISYALEETVASLLAGIAIIGAGFAVALLSQRRTPTILLGGLVVGAGVIVLHYLGMSAVRLPGRLTFDPDLVVASVVFSLTFGAASFYFVFGPERRYGHPLGIGLFVLMIVSLHFTAMGAVNVELGLWREPEPDLSRDVLASLVIVVTIAVLTIGLAGALFDRQRAAQLRAQAQRFQVLSDSALEGLVIHRDGVLVDSNAAARSLLALGEEHRGQSIFGWFATTDPAQIEQWVLHPSEKPAEVDLVSRDGSRLIAEICGQPLQLADGSAGHVLAIRDVTARKAAEAQLQHQALHDPLTDLPNRRLFREIANKVRSRAERNGEQFAVLIIDLDGFKAINDLQGHDGGDRMLVELARRIPQGLRESDIFARFGGDEFAIVETGIHQPQDAVVLAKRLIDLIAKPVELLGAQVMAGASIGIAVYPAGGETIEELLRNADTAMYRAKADGKGTYRCFEPQMDVALESRRALEGRLRFALAERSLTVAYQPLVDSRTREPTGFEALARWVDDTLSPVPPSQFIPVAEETGLIVPLGEHILRTACRDAVHWPAPLRVAVNLAAAQFRRPGLVQTVERILEETGFPASRLDLEITESILIGNRDQVLEALRGLKALGVRISMDDFGTGYSSLGYLQSFPFDKIKIDRVFVSDLAAEGQSTSIVKAVMAMGQSLRMTVVAEGVETEGQAFRLRDMDCDELQGYLIAKPMAADEVEAFLRRRPKGPWPHVVSNPP